MSREHLIDGKSVVVNTQVTDCYSGQLLDSTCTLQLKQTTKFDWIIHVVKGAVTGFEYIGVSSLKRDRFDDGWLACAGRPGEYDRLFISGAEMKRAFIELGIHKEET